MKLLSDYHTHSNFSRFGHGKNTIEQMVYYANEIGLEEFAITDHGLSHPCRTSIEKLRKARTIIDDINTWSKTKVLLGIEADILNTNGDLDITEEVLELIDVLAAGYHTGIKTDFANIFGWQKKSQAAIDRATSAYLNAIERYPINFITHIDSVLTTDLYKIGCACKEHDIAIEINDRHVKWNKKQVDDLVRSGCMFIVNSDAHSTEEIGRADFAFKTIKEFKIPAFNIINVEFDKEEMTEEDKEMNLFYELYKDKKDVNEQKIEEYNYKKKTEFSNTLSQEMEDALRNIAYEKGLEYEEKKEDTGIVSNESLIDEVAEYMFEMKKKGLSYKDLNKDNDSEEEENIASNNYYDDDVGSSDFFSSLYGMKYNVSDEMKEEYIRRKNERHGLIDNEDFDENAPETDVNSEDFDPAYFGITEEDYYSSEDEESEQNGLDSQKKNSNRLNNQVLNSSSNGFGDVSLDNTSTRDSFNREFSNNNLTKTNQNINKSQNIESSELLRGSSRDNTNLYGGVMSDSSFNTNDFDDFDDLSYDEDYYENYSEKKPSSSKNFDSLNEDDNSFISQKQPSSNTSNYATGIATSRYGDLDGSVSKLVAERKAQERNINHGNTSQTPPNRHFGNSFSDLINGRSSYSPKQRTNTNTNIKSNTNTTNTSSAQKVSYNSTSSTATSNNVKFNSSPAQISINNGGFNSTPLGFNSNKTEFNSASAQINSNNPQVNKSETINLNTNNGLDNNTSSSSGKSYSISSSFITKTNSQTKQPNKSANRGTFIGFDNNISSQNKKVVKVEPKQEKPKRRAGLSNGLVDFSSLKGEDDD